MHVRIALVVALALGASACQGADETPSPTPTAGEVSTGVVDVGGYGLDWTCEGEGSPTIVAEAGYDSAGRYEDVLTVSLWDRTQADLATLSSNSVFVQARGGHFVMNDDPQVLLAAIRAVVESARSSEPLPPCERVLEGTDGTCP